MPLCRTFAPLFLVGRVWGLPAPKPAAAADAPAVAGFPVAPKASFRDCPDCPQMVVLPLGDYMMGSPAGERYRFDNEGPQHLVHVTHPIAIGMHTITAGEL